MKKIVIDNPCTVRWNGMKKTEAGRFCGVCETEVRDYSNKSASEIALMIEELSKQKFCAKFNEDHVVVLNRPKTDLGLKRYFPVILLTVLMFFGCKTRKKTTYSVPRFLDFNEDPHKTEQQKVPVPTGKK